MTNEDRQLLLSYAFSNISLEAGKVTVSYTSAFEFLATWVPAVNEHFELENSVDLKEQNSSFELLRPVLCAGQDSNLCRNTPGGLQPPAFDHSATDACYLNFS